MTGITLETLSITLEAWRSQKRPKDRIPEVIWDQIFFLLANGVSKSEIRSATRIIHTRINQEIKKRQNLSQPIKEETKGLNVDIKTESVTEQKSLLAQKSSKDSITAPMIELFRSDGTLDMKIPTSISPEVLKALVGIRRN